MADLASLYIKVDSTGVVTASKDLNTLETNAKKVETATQSMATGFSKLQWVVAALAGSYALLKSAQYIKEATDLAAKYEMLGITMRQAGATAGYTGAQMEKVAQGMQQVGISMIASRENTMKMVIANLDLAKATELARVAQDVARVANINSSEAFTRMIQGIRSGETEIFKTLGMQINMEAAYRKFETTHNLVNGAITAGQKAQAIMNEVLKEGNKYAGLYEATLKTAAGQMLSMQRHMENLKVSLGLAFTPALAEIVEAITGGVTSLNKEMSGSSKDAILDWGNNFRLILISLRSEILFIAQGLDKVGGTLTAAKALLFTPGKMIGNENSTRGYNEAMAENKMFEDRYKAHGEVIDKLAAKYVALEYDMTAQGKSEIAWAAFVADAKIASAKRIEKEETVLTEKQLTIRENFAKAHAKLTLSTEKAEIVSMELQYAEFKKGAVNETQLEEWKQAELRNIRLRAQNEQLALLEELATATGLQRYQDAAIAVMTEILNAEEAKWKTILGNDEDAHTLRLKREQEYADKVKGIIKEIVQSEKEAIVETAALPISSSITPSISGTSSIGEYTGMPIGSSSGFTIYNVGGSVFYNLRAAQDYSQQIQAIADNTAAAAKAATEKAAQDAIQVAEEKAQKLKEIADKNLDLNIQILELTGQSEAALTARRLLELSTMDSTSQLLQRRIYYLEDEAKAMEKAAEANALLASKQDAVAEAWKISLTQMVSAGQAINNFLKSLSGGGNATNTYNADLSAARSGDFDAYSRITQSAGNYITQATKSASSPQDVARAIAKVRSDLSSLSPVTQLDRNLEALQSIKKATEDTAKSTGNLDVVGIKAIFDLSSVITFVADAVGIPDDLRKIITDQTKDYQVFLKATLDSSVSGPLKRVLIDSSGVYAATVTAIAGDIDNDSRKLAITAAGFYTATVESVMGRYTDEESKKLAITAAGSYLATVNTALGIVDTDSRKLALTALGTYEATIDAALGTVDLDARKLALNTTNNLLTTVTAVLGETDVTARALGLNATNSISAVVNASIGIVDDNSRKLALDALGDYVTTVKASAGTLDAKSQKLAIDALGDYEATVNAAMGISDPEARKLALTGLGDFATTVLATFGSADAKSTALALTAAGDYLATVKGAIGAVDVKSTILALDKAGDYLTTVKGQLGTVDATALSLATKLTNTINTTVNLSAGTIPPEVQTLLSTTASTITKTVDVALGVTDADAKKLGLSTTNTLATTVTASLGLTDNAAKTLAINTANSIAATVTAALGSGNADALDLAVKTSNAFTTTITAALATDADSQALADLLTGNGVTTALTATGSLVWNPDNQLKSIFDAILAQTTLTANNTGRYSTLVEEGAGYKYRWDISNSVTGGTIAGGSLIKGAYETTADYYTRLNLARPQGFADGGIASGPESGYQATLHGTELIVSPKASYSATVKGGDNVVLIEELRALRAEVRAGNLQLSKNTLKTAKVMDQIDQALNTDGLLTRTS